jgi:long-chain acyl-CoA synthetase
LDPRDFHLAGCLNLRDDGGEGTVPQHRDHLSSLVGDLRRLGPQTAIKSRRGLRHESCSYAALAELAGRAAAYLESRQIRKGDRIVIWGENGAEWLAAYYGCLLRGAVPVPVDIAGSAEFARRVVGEVSPKLIFGEGVQDAPPCVTFAEFDRTFPRTPLFQPAAGLAESDTLQIVFTSGTTGEPKGVVHTHGNVLASLRPIEQEMEKYMKYERLFHPLGFLHTLPLSHVFGQFMGIWIPALMGPVVHFEQSLIAGDLIESIRHERISVLACVPRVLEILASDLRMRFPDLDARLLRARGLSVARRWWLFREVHRAFGLKFWALVCGGATLKAGVEDFWGTLGFAVIQGYGMTETAAIVSLNHPFHSARGSIGQVLPGREVRLSDDGEILVRGATVSGASWEQGALHPRESEWLATGDLGALDESGNLTFRGRKKDVIVTAAGMNIYPEDLEAALLRQPLIRAAAVVEIDGRQGPQPMAALVLHDSGDPSETVRAANLELAEFQQIRRWAVWPDPDLPRTSTGKVLRRQVAAALRSSGGAPEAEQGGLAGLVRQVAGESSASGDLNLDSLGRVELQSAIETQFGVQISESDFQKIQSLGELKALLQSPHAAAPPAQEFVYSEWPWSTAASAARIVFIELVMRPLVRFLAAPRVSCDLKTNTRRPMLIVANHVTAFDVPILLQALPTEMRHRVAVAMAGEMLLDMRRGRKQESWWLNLAGPFEYLLLTLLLNVFPLPQRGSFRASFAHAGKAMDRGYHVLVFPEGRRTPDAAMHKFLGGAGILWKELGCDALPVYLGGLAELKASNSRWFRSGHVFVRVGKPLPVPAGLGAAELAGLLERKVRALSAY